MPVLPPPADAHADIQNSEKNLRNDSESLDVVDIHTRQKNKNTPKNAKKLTNTNYQNVN